MSNPNQPTPAPLLIDLSHTCHTRARTGIQRVVRSVHAALGGGAAAVTFDPFAIAWRQLEAWEEENLQNQEPAPKRGARWPLLARVRGRLNHLVHRTFPLPANAGLLVPEIFSVHAARNLPALFAATAGPRVAIFHDAIALKLPEITPAATVARFPGYLRELLAFDGVVAVSEDSRQSLLDYWAWLGVRNVPVVATIGWATDAVGPAGLKDRRFSAPPLSSAGGHVLDEPEPVVLSVGSIEGRKNHLALLDACDRLWASGERFTLQLIGLAHPQTGGPALARMRALQDADRPLRYDGPVSDDAISRAYAGCSFTVYPSLMEGFGLPVLESLAHRRVCICSGRGALGESARGGGCVTIDPVDASNLAAAIQRMLHSPGERAQLEAAAARRTFKTWPQYAEELCGWIRTVPRRD